VSPTAFSISAFFIFIFIAFLSSLDLLCPPTPHTCFCFFGLFGLIHPFFIFLFSFFLKHWSLFHGICKSLCCLFSSHQITIPPNCSLTVHTLVWAKPCNGSLGFLSCVVSFKAGQPSLYLLVHISSVWFFSAHHLEVRLSAQALSTRD
jgi:hypothetical protein